MITHSVKEIRQQKEQKGFEDHVKNRKVKFVSTLKVLIVLSQQQHNRPTL